MLFGDAERTLMRDRKTTVPVEVVSIIYFLHLYNFSSVAYLIGHGPSSISYRLRAACTTPALGSSP